MADARDFGSVDVGNFTVGAMLRAGIAIRKAVRGATTIVEAGDAVTRFLYEVCRDPDAGDRVCALVRLYKTHPFGQLPPDLQRFAAERLDGHPASAALRCLTLVSTIGDEPDWNAPHTSRGHRAIPLPSADSIRAAPMIMRLIDELGVDVDTVVAGAAAPQRPAEARTYDVFHVERAAGSPYIPAQSAFVLAHGIASVVGFGGMLRSGELFAVILFSRAHIPAESAARFRAIALDVRSALFSFDDSRLDFA